MPFVRPAVDWYAIAPEIAIFGAGLLIVAFAAVTHRAPILARLHLWVALTGVAVAGVFIFPIWHRWNEGLEAVDRVPSYTTLNGAVSIDGASIFLKAVVLIAVLFGILIAWSYLKRENLEKPEYLALLLFSASGMLMMTSANDLVVVFVSLEILSISLYVLAAFQRANATSQEAAIKYFVLGAFSSAIFLYGVALVYGATGSTNLGQISRVINDSQIQGSTYDDKLILVGIMLLLVGLGFKVAAVPFHMWTPDVYQGAPTPVTGFMAAGAKIAAFAALLRAFSVSFQGNQDDWRPALWAVTVLTLVVASAVALVQSNVKRMLAYSSISHAGYMLVGVQVATVEGTAAVLTYLFVYTFLTLGTFTVVTLMARQGDEGHELSDYRGLAVREPLLAKLLTLFLLAQAGIPLTSGFIAKLKVFQAAVDREVYSLAVIGMLASVVAAFVYLRLIVTMFTGPGIDEHPEHADVAHGGGTAVAIAAPPRVRVDLASGIVLALAAAVTIFVGILPNELLEFAKRSVF